MLEGVMSSPALPAVLTRAAPAVTAATLTGTLGLAAAARRPAPPRASRDGSHADGDARARRRGLGGRGPADARDGHGGGDPARLVHVFYRRVGGDDCGGGAGGRGPGGAATHPGRWRACRAAVHRVLPRGLGTSGRRGVCAV